MNKRKVLAALAALLCILLTAHALAMSSDNYRLDWFTPLTSGGGGAASSANYAINYTVGQTAIATSASGNYAGCLGYWCAGAVEYEVFLPVVLRDH